MLQLTALRDTQRGALLVVGLLLGVTLAIGTASLNWRVTAVGLGFVLAVLAGVVQRCST